MPRAALIMIVMTAFALSLGCARKPAALIGTWQVDVEKTLAAMHERDDYKKMPENRKKQSDEEASKQMASATFSFTETKMTLRIGPISQEIDYKITAQDGDKWTMETTEPNKKTETVTLTWTDNDHIGIQPPSGQGHTMYLTRKSSTPEQAASPASSGPSVPASPAATGPAPTSGIPGDTPGASPTPGGSDSPGPTATESRRPLRDRIKEKIRKHIP